MRPWMAVPLLLVLTFTGCATLTSAQSAGLQEAQKLADEVTAAYGVEHVKVIPDRNTYEGISAYWARDRWITMHPSVLADQSRLRQRMASLLATATLGHETFSGSGTQVPRLRQERFERNWRAVEIMVKFLHMTTPKRSNGSQRSSSHKTSSTLPL